MRRSRSATSAGRRPGALAIRTTSASSAAADAHAAPRPRSATVGTSRSTAIQATLARRRGRDRRPHRPGPGGHRPDVPRRQDDRGEQHHEEHARAGAASDRHRPVRFDFDPVDEHAERARIAGRGRGHRGEADRERAIGQGLPHRHVDDLAPGLEHAHRRFERAGGDPELIGASRRMRADGSAHRGHVPARRGTVIAPAPDVHRPERSQARSATCQPPPSVAASTGAPTSIRTTCGRLRFDERGADRDAAHQQDQQDSADEDAHG